MIPCTTTLYRWIDIHIMKTRNIDSLEMLRRSTKVRAPRTRPHKKILGTSNDEGSEEINGRTSFDRWEIDTGIGKKGKEEPSLLTFVERLSRFEVILKIENETALLMDAALKSLREHVGGHFSIIFKCINADNGLEFENLSQTLANQMAVYSPHPYTT